MKKKQIINIVNFIRACEPREYVDLIKPVREQIKLINKSGLTATFLIQYDALIDPAFTDMLTCLDSERFEIGVWFEVVGPLVEKIGLKWTGRYPWDWHTHCGFSVGYTLSERERLVDELYGKFHSVFGYYPKVFGSWFFDSHTAEYVSDKYGADAFCNCKEQYGTDGYTLWGGYYGQGYYPCRKNVFMPAQTDENKLPVPLFRMLGSDPVYQYDFGLDLNLGAEKIQQVITLEPVYQTAGGGNPKWVDWYMAENFNGECLSFGYAQAGQENSFGWDKMRQGLEYQFALFAKLQAENKITVEPLGRTGRWFKQNYSQTPPSAITAHSTWDGKNVNSLWYCSKNYRINLMLEDGRLRIRDLHVFSENHPDPFESRVCTTNEASYYTLPVADGNIHSGDGVLAGIYFTDLDNGIDIPCKPLSFSEPTEGVAKADFGSISITLSEKEISIFRKGGFKVQYRYSPKSEHMPKVILASEKELSLSYDGTSYGFDLIFGKFTSPTEAVSEIDHIALTIK